MKVNILSFHSHRGYWELLSTLPTTQDLLENNFYGNRSCLNRGEVPNTRASWHSLLLLLQTSGLVPLLRYGGTYCHQHPQYRNISKINRTLYAKQELCRRSLLRIYTGLEIITFPFAPARKYFASSTLFFVALGTVLFIIGFAMARMICSTLTTIASKAIIFSFRSCSAKHDQRSSYIERLYLVHGLVYQKVHWFVLRWLVTVCT